ncbi:MAG: oxygen-independent coproporphyrinogen III oxidase [Rickettsiales bacterium]|nr:oxygen-independent coproporphyrinogen III oxidase [Rickettsiales bacterium]
MANQYKAAVLAHDRPAPRYTSYPPATQFADFEDTTWRDTSLRAVREDARISLYIHVPFCSKLCYYCGCFTNVTRKPERINRYIDALLAEANMVAQRLPRGVTIAHLHFGGGSPTQLDAMQFRDLMNGLRSAFQFEPNADIAIEADPRQLTEAKIAAYAQSGINRISFGVQDFCPQVLHAVNRDQGPSLSWQGVQWCRAYGITNINFDLMYGLPHQTAESITETVQLAADMAPSRIAFFGYAHVPWMKNHMQAIDLEAMPGASARYDMFHAGLNALEETGYHAVGIDHFVAADDPMYLAWKQHTLKRNFQGYTTDALPTLIGLGASAINHLPHGYIQNKVDMAAYESACACGELPPSRGFLTQPGDEAHAAIISDIMCYFAVDLQPYSDTVDLEKARTRLQPLIDDGLVVWEGTRLHIPHEPQLLARLVAAAFDAYTPWPKTDGAPHPQRHAQAI